MILNDDRQEDTTYVIEHYGKKGMHWGQRKQSVKSNAGVVKAKPKSMSPERKKQLKKVAIGVGLVGGAAVAAVLISRHSNMKVGQIRADKKLYAQHAAQAKKIVQENSRVKVPTSEAHKAFMKEFTSKQRRINSASNQSLKSLYSLAETPISRRGYLPEWG